MASAQLNEQGIDRADLHPRSATDVAHLGRGNVILAVGVKERQGLKPRDDLRSRTGPIETLKQLLQHQAGGHDGVRSSQRISQGPHLRLRRRAITPKRQ